MLFTGTFRLKKTNQSKMTQCYDYLQVWCCSVWVTFAGSTVIHVYIIMVVLFVVIFSNVPQTSVNLPPVAGFTKPDARQTTLVRWVAGFGARAPRAGGAATSSPSACAPIPAMTTSPCLRWCVRHCSTGPTNSTKTTMRRTPRR